MLTSKRKRITWILISLFLLVTTATIVYWSILDISFTDALYMTIITISTVGYKEVAEMTPLAKVFSIFVIFGGIGLVGYTFTTLEIMILESNFAGNRRTRLMRKRIEGMKDHVIIAGDARARRSSSNAFFAPKRILSS
ncbi:MAG: potassium channel family protein [Bacillota bacterium]|nr:potassium channel family protein [Bacillota bacterium]